ncbi:hypothetical protein O1611_g5891 [Lasiodiplodia mahajangana]|uniref:Uncharacterized protein n=1 Tax=Lasiodiplodia mahajangana TaxID=1108764 RepID=A0ACC2JJP0_9PEZI|nr:hypothetical protein O1611_g5891 [Lasiodiplodia mahajangana]
MAEKIIRIRSEGDDTYITADIFTLLNANLKPEVEARCFVVLRQEDLALYGNAANKHKRDGLDGFFFLGSPRTAALNGADQGTEFPITASLLSDYNNIIKVEAALPGQIKQVLVTPEKWEPSTVKYEYAREEPDKR